MKSSALFETEQEAVAKARPARRDEFIAGRSAARLALAAIGGPQVAIAVGPRREPLWPQGYTGSITHCDGFCAAVVCRAAAARGLGLDAEPRQALAADVAPLVCSEAEYPKNWTAPAPASTVIFTAKEAYLKTAATVCGEIVAFEQIAVRFTSFTARGGDFTVRRRDHGRTAQAYQGAWTLLGDHIVTGVWALAEGAQRPLAEADRSWA
jgi:4'-phosphopantetheinyl transferase EntD